MSRQPETTLPPVRWGVREEGNMVFIEFEMRDNYEAIEFAEHIAEGMREGEITLEFNDEQS